MHGLVRALMALVSLALVGAPGDLALAQGRAQQEPVIVAAPLSLTGGGSTYGVPTLDGIRFAIEEATAADPRLQIRLEPIDDESDDAKARAAAERIVAGKAVVALGPNFGTASVAAGPVYAAAGLASLPPTATSDAITRNATTFRVIFKNSDQGEFLAQYLVRVLGKREASVVVVQSGTGETLREGFEQAASRLGIEAKYHPLARDADESAISRVAASVAEDLRPVILLVLDREGARLLSRLRRLGHAGPFLGADPFGDETFTRLLANEPEERTQPGIFTEGLYGLTPVILDSANAEQLAFARRFRARFGHAPRWEAAAGYDAATIAIDAIRHAVDAAPGDPAAQRTRVAHYLLGLKTAQTTRSGLLGPFRFDENRARQQAIRIGRFTGGRFESAPVQIVSVTNPSPQELASGAVFEMGPGRHGRLQRVVYAGLHINEIQQLDVSRSSFAADFYVWLRFAKAAGVDAADATDILFPTNIRSTFDRSRPSERRLSADGTEYWLWRVQGEFRNDFDLRRFPFDRQTLSLPLFNSRAANDRIVYVIDRAANASPRAGTGSREIAPETAFRNITQWDFVAAVERRENLVTQSPLGDLDRIAARNGLELSGFLATIDLERRSLSTLAKTLLPLLLMSLITFTSLFFPATLVAQKVTVAITGVLSAVVLLTTVNNQLGSIGYTVAVEYVFYAFFALSLLCIVSILSVELLRGGHRIKVAHGVEWTTRAVYALAIATALAVILAVR